MLRSLLIYFVQVDDSDGEHALAGEAVGGEPLRLEVGTHGDTLQFSPNNDHDVTVVTIETRDDSGAEGNQ